MDALKEKWHSLIWEKIKQVAEEKFQDASSPHINLPARDNLVAEIPPRPEMGDLAFPMFPFAAALKISPRDIAVAVYELFSGESSDLPGKVEAAGAYVNIYFSKPDICRSVLEIVESKGKSYGLSEAMKDIRIMCEFSCPNTNKPLHLGHLRNDALGESISRILKANGAEVLKAILINDRGIHICKSMLAYQKFGNGQTPENENIKPDHFVGRYYVKYDELAKEFPGAEEEARELLRKWEGGEPGTMELWKTMNDWAVNGIEETYRRTGISFDRVYYESDTYLSGRKEVIKGLEGGIFYKKDDGSVWVDLTGENLDHKVLLRGDGTSLYVTQDIGTAIERYKDWPFQRLIYVVASEQKYHFRVLFKVLDMLGFPWAKDLHHLAYGMVNLPEGKMKSREGTVVDADDLIDELVDLARAEIRDKGREEDIEDIDAVSEKIALGALNYYLLQAAALKDITFTPSESISFTGNTGPYLQYTGARISSILRKFAHRGKSLSAGESGKFDPELLTVKEEWELVKLIADYPNRVEQAGKELNPSLLAGHLYDIARNFNKYYHDNPVLHNENPDLVMTRIHIVRAVKTVLENAFALLGIPFLEKM